MASASCLLAVVLAYLVHRTAGSIFDSSNRNIAIYWGSNSLGLGAGPLAQQTLAYYCEHTENVDIIPLAFLTKMTTGTGASPLELNFANQLSRCTNFPGTKLANCSASIGEDIKICQRKYNKVILLSIGGDQDETGFASAEAAVQTADLIWKTFGPVPPDQPPAKSDDDGSTADPTMTAASGILRPFGDAVIDGFDFDFEGPARSNILPFAQHLQTRMRETNVTANTSKDFYLTAAPQCPYPDASDKDLLLGNVEFDAVWVQFYNNLPCQASSFVSSSNSSSSTQEGFNFAQWDQWARETSANKDVRVSLGVPAGPSAAADGYMSASALEQVIEYSRDFASFGGIMLWDMSQAYNNTGFLDDVAQAVRHR